MAPARWSLLAFGLLMTGAMAAVGLSLVERAPGALWGAVGAQIVALGIGLRILDLTAGAMAGNERALGRQRLMTQTGAALVAAADREEIYETALAAAHALVVRTPGAAVAVGVGPPDGLTVVVAAPAYAGPPSSASETVPLTIAGEPFGAVLVEAPEPLPRDLREAFDSLGVLVSLALDASAATEALRQSERRFRSLVQNASDVVLILDADRRVTYASASLKAVLGRLPETLAGETIAPLVHPGDAPVLEAALDRLERSPGSPRLVDFRVRHADGRWRDVEAIAVHRRDDPAVAGVVLTVRDVSERRALEERLHKAQKLETVGILAGGVAHDFNNLLTAILGNAELLRRRAAGTDCREVDGISKAAQRAAALTAQLLAYGRRQTLRVEVVDLNDVVRGMEDMLRSIAGERIDVVVVLDPAGEKTRVDPGRLEQAIANLALNARDAMPDGGRLEIRTGTADVAEGSERSAELAPGTYALLEVADSGHGMDARTQARAFEPFFTTKQRGSGTGLGLASVYGIVKQSGGSIEVESEPGEGATFRVLLPRVDAQRQVPTAAAPTPAVPAGTETVLLVEDEEAVRGLVRQALERAGYTVCAAADGLEALRIADGHASPIDLLVTDVIMPGMSGRQLADRLAPARPSMRVLFISGYTDDVIGREGVLEPARAFLQKPFTMLDLVGKAREVLDSPAVTAT